MLYVTAVLARLTPAEPVAESGVADEVEIVVEEDLLARLKRRHVAQRLKRQIVVVDLVGRLGNGHMMLMILVCSTSILSMADAIVDGRFELIFIAIVCHLGRLLMIGGQHDLRRLHVERLAAIHLLLHAAVGRGRLRLIWILHRWHE